jgi:hypothetical protein
MPDDADWPLAVAMWSEVAARTGDRDAAATLREMLLFHNGTQMWTSGISCGPAARLLANLEHVLGSAADADRHFAEAVESSRRINSPIWVARCQLDWAKTWILRGETVRAVQLIYAADAVTEALTLPALRQQSAMLRDQLGPC